MQTQFQNGNANINFHYFNNYVSEFKVDMSSTDTNDYCINIADKDSKISQKFANHFEKILQIHRFVGITYRGWQLPHVNSSFRKSLLTLYEVLIVLQIFTYYLLVVNKLPSIFFAADSSKIIMKMIVRIANYMNLVQFVVIKSVLFLYGPNLMDILYRLNKDYSQVNYKLLIFIPIHAILFGVCLSFTFLSKNELRVSFNLQIMTNHLQILSFPLGSFA